MKRSSFTRRALFLTGLAALVAGARTLAAPNSELPMARPEAVGIDSERLRRIDDVIQRYMDEHKLSGAVTLVARRGKVVRYQALGLMDLEAKTPMRRDAMFRMASSTKPVTAVAILMLVEEGKVRLSDPVSRFIPQFQKMNVAVRTANGETRLEPASREITIRDLLTHTSGLMSGLEAKPKRVVATF